MSRELKLALMRVSALLNGKIESFRLDTLVDIAHRLSLHVTIDVVT
jgi:predicted XRE-type DNA-binding protein